MSNSINSYTKENYKIVSFLTGICLTGILIVLTIFTFIDINNQTVLTGKTRAANIDSVYQFQNDSVNIKINNSGFLGNEFYVVFNEAKKEYSLKSEFYPYSEFIHVPFLLIMLLLNYWFYKIRMKSDRP
jgi:hypothetical protein